MFVVFEEKRAITAAGAESVGHGLDCVDGGDRIGTTMREQYGPIDRADEIRRRALVVKLLVLRKRADE
jgi:hypothetical protein